MNLTVSDNFALEQCVEKASQLSAHQRKCSLTFQFNVINGFPFTLKVGQTHFSTSVHQTQTTSVFNWLWKQWQWFSKTYVNVNDSFSQKCTQTSADTITIVHWARQYELPLSHQMTYVSWWVFRTLSTPADPGRMYLCWYEELYFRFHLKLCKKTKSKQALSLLLWLLWILRCLKAHWNILVSSNILSFP